MAKNVTVVMHSSCGRRGGGRMAVEIEVPFSIFVNVQVYQCSVTKCTDLYSPFLIPTFSAVRNSLWMRCQVNEKNGSNGVFRA